MQAVVAAGTGATPAAFYLGLCRLRGTLSPSAYHNCAAGGPFFTATTIVLQAGHSSLTPRKLESDECRCRGRDRFHSGGFFLRIMPQSWHPVPACTPRLRCRRTALRCSSDDAAAISKSGPEIKNRCSLWVVLEGFLASIRKFGLEIKNRCTKKAVSEENLASIPKSGPEIKNRCTQEGLNGEKLASIPKFGLEIKNRCTQEGINGEKHASIRKFGLEIKNRCTKKAVSEENLASIPKSGPEIKNRCSSLAVLEGFLAAIPKFDP